MRRQIKGKLTLLIYSVLKRKQGAWKTFDIEILSEWFLCNRNSLEKIFRSYVRISKQAFNSVIVRKKNQTTNGVNRNVPNRLFYLIETWILFYFYTWYNIINFLLFEPFNKWQLEKHFARVLNLKPLILPLIDYVKT